MNKTIFKIADRRIGNAIANVQNFTVDSYQYLRKSAYTNFLETGKFFEIPIRHIRFGILNFENLTTDSKSATSKTPRYELSVNMIYCLMENDFFLKKVIFYLIYY